MTTYIYKSFDTSEFLFETIWRDFPNLRTTKDEEEIINKLIISSKEFCNMKEKNEINMKYLSEGGFGAVGLIKLKNQRIKSLIFSFSRTGDHNLFSVDAIVKISQSQIKPIIYKINTNTISITDPISEMVFGSMLGHLYDIGVCPFIVKYFGNYFCEYDKKSAIVTEAADIELRDKLNRFKNQILKPIELKNILFQYIYSLYIYKYYFGIVHFDTHLRNLMLTDISTKDYVYHGKMFSNINMFLFETKLKHNNKPLLIAIKKQKYLLKIIDFGTMLSELSRSQVLKFRRDLNILTDINNITKIGAKNALYNSFNNDSNANTLDLVFTMVNMYQHMFIGLDIINTKGDYNSREFNRERLEILNEIFFSLFNTTLTDFLENNPQFNVLRKIDGTFDWFMRNHDTGFQSGFDNINYLLNGLIKSCTKTVTVSNFPFKNTSYYQKTIIITYFEDLEEFFKPGFENYTIFLTHKPTEYETLYNRFEQILKQEEKCKFNKQKCDILKFYDNNRDSKESLNDENILIQNKNFKINLKTKVFYKNKVVYKNYNSWFNKKPIPKEKINKFIEDTRIYMVQLYNNFNKTFITENSKLIKTTGLSLPIGNFLFFQNIPKTVGFYANSSTNNVHHLTYPNFYEKYLGVLYCKLNNEIVLEKYSDFVARHETVDKIQKLNSLEMLIPNIIIPLKILNGNKYKWAVTVGPLLVYDFKLILDENSSTFRIGDVLINEKDFISKYGIHLSTEIETQLIFISKGIHIGFVLVEGSHFSPGLDRIECAKMMKNLNVEKAVICSSGINANIIYNLNGKVKSVSKSSLLTTQSTILNFDF